MRSANSWICWRRSHRRWPGWTGSPPPPLRLTEPRRFTIAASDGTGRRPGPGHRRQRDLRGLPGRAGRPGGPAVPVPVHQLHQLRAAVHHRHRRALRPAADDDGGVRHVRGLRGGVPRPGRPPLPRPADLLPGVRAAAARCWTRGRAEVTAGAAGRRRRGVLRRGRGGSRSRDWAATTWRWTRAASKPRRRCGRASTGRTSRSRSWSPTWRRRGALCEVDEAGETLLDQSPAADRAAAPALAARRSRVRSRRATASSGSCFPTRPLHHLLLRELGRPIVLTSGNVSDEPIAYTDEDALARLAGIADAFLTHDRAIHIRTDDSVVRAVPRAGARCCAAVPRLRAGAAHRARAASPGRCWPAAPS